MIQHKQKELLLLSLMTNGLDDGPYYLRITCVGEAYLKTWIPVAFGEEHKDMLAHCKELLEYQNGMVAIHPRHNKLITALGLL